MAYRIEFAPAALRDVKKLSPAIQQRVRRRIDALAEDPRPPGSVAMQGIRGRLRVRVGDHRIIYEVHDDVLLVLIIEVGHRREVYRP